MPWRICLFGVVAAVAAGSVRADTIPYPTTGFGNGGIANVDAVEAVVAARDGTIVVAGGGDRDVLLSRYSAGGKPIGFGARGRPHSLATGVDCSPGLAIRQDGTILVACGDIVAALRPGGGVRFLTSIPGAEFDSVGVDILGRAIAAGKLLVRLQTDGSIDASFSRTPLPAAATSLVVDGGRILVVAGGSIRGFDDDGALDTSFGNAGVAAFPGFTATSVGAYSHWIVAGGSYGHQAAVVRFFAGGALDTFFGEGGISAWGPEPHMQDEEVVALGVRAGGAIDTAVLEVAIADVFNSSEHPEYWLVQRVTSKGQLGESGAGPTGYIDPTLECLQELPVALAEQSNGMTLVSGTACVDAIDYTPYYLLERYDRRLEPDVGVALRARIRDVRRRGDAVTVRVAVNGPCRLLARIQALDGSKPIGGWLSPTRLDVAHGPAFLRLRLIPNELRPRVRYVVVVSAYDARGYFTNARAPLTRS
jgi:hypothetical protein